MQKTKVLDRLLILSVGFILTLPVIVYGFPFYSDDGATHALWYTHFSEQLWGGDLYPRWLQGMNAGLGSPAFFYYPPLPYYITSFISGPFFNDPTGWRHLGLSAAVALAASGLSALFWLEKLTGRRAALIAALLYMLMPYHAAVALYLRGGFAELWAFVWMPLVLHYVDEVIAERRFASAGLAVSYALVITTHLPTTLIFSPLVVCYGFFVAGPGRKARTLAVVSAAMALGVGLSAAYLLPALTAQRFVSFRALSTGHYNYENWFLFSTWGTRGLKAILSWSVLTAVIPAYCAYLVARASEGEARRREASFWAAAMAASVFLMAPLSKPVWQVVTVLQRVSFPWRFNTILVLAATASCALGVHSLRRPSSGLAKGALMVALILFASWVPVTFWAARRNVQTPWPAPDKKERLDEINAKLQQHRDVDEYRPIWAAEKSDNVEPFLKMIAQPGQGDDKVTVVEGAGAVTLAGWRPRVIDLNVSSAGGVLLDVHQFYYPGWTAYLDGNSQPVPVSPSEDKGLLRVAAPAGQHRLQLRLNRSAVEVAGMIASACSLILILALYARSVFARRAPAG